MCAVKIIMLVMSLHVTLTVSSPTKHSLCDPSLEDQHLPDPTHCSRYFRCVYGKMVPKECPERMLFNPDIGNCDLFYNVDCPHHKTNDDLVPLNLQEAIENLTGRSFTREEEEKTVTDPSTAKFVYLPHETNPTGYYKVENGVKDYFSCEHGKVFNFDLEVCTSVS